MQVVDRIVYRRELLQMSRRFKALHDLLLSSDRLMRILRSIVHLLMLTMITMSETPVSFGRAV